MASQTNPTPIDVAVDVSRTLEQVGDALIRFDAEALVSAEPRVADLAERLSRLTALTAEQQQALRPMLQQARAALAQCERLGAQLHALAAESYAVAAPAYGRRGSSSPRQGSPRMEAKA